MIVQKSTEFQTCLVLRDTFEELQRDALQMLTLLHDDPAYDFALAGDPGQQWMRDCISYDLPDGILAKNNLRLTVQHSTIGSSTRTKTKLKHKGYTARMVSPEKKKRSAVRPCAKYAQKMKLEYDAYHGTMRYAMSGTNIVPGKEVHFESTNDLWTFYPNLCKQLGIRKDGPLTKTREFREHVFDHLGARIRETDTEFVLTYRQGVMSELSFKLDETDGPVPYKTLIEFWRCFWSTVDHPRNLYPDIPAMVHVPTCIY